MKRIAIFCDGTWNRADARNPTNVVVLSKLVKQTASDGAAQVSIYQQGIGNGSGNDFFAQQLDRIGGGAFGWGLTRKVEKAYAELVENYEIGDEICIFGFSRGAYTARSLVGLIRNCGIPSKETRSDLPEAVRRYRSRDPDDHPNSESSLKFRARFSPDIATSPAELTWRTDQGKGECRLLNISYIGVWDTVGSLGIPRFLGPVSRLSQRRYQFHDTSLSSSVWSARHAIGIDEQRRTFEPTTWSNLDPLNTGQDRQNKPYRQEWFPGEHGAIGGGGEIRGLSNGALIWIADGAQDAGLEFDPAGLETLKDAVDIRVSLKSTNKKPGLVWRVLARLKRPRRGPSQISDVSDLARERWNITDPPPEWGGPYRPESLSRVASEM